MCLLLLQRVISTPFLSFAQPIAGNCTAVLWSRHSPEHIVFEQPLAWEISVRLVCRSLRAAATQAVRKLSEQDLSEVESVLAFSQLTDLVVTAPCGRAPHIAIAGACNISRLSRLHTLNCTAGSECCQPLLAPFLRAHAFRLWEPRLCSFACPAPIVQP